MKIVTISDSPTLFSGLARVHRHVIDGLIGSGHQVLCCGWFAYDEAQMEKVKKGEQVDPVYYDGPNGRTRVMCVPKTNGTQDMYAIYDVIDYFKPDVVITIGDHWQFWYMRAVKIKCGFKFAWIPYLTIEHDDIEDRWVKMLQYADTILVPSEFGKSVLDAVMPGKSTFVPYGTEDVFKCPSQRERRSLRRKRDCDDKVRFITVAQNTLRKNLPALIQAVKLIAHRDPERKMRFYIHTNIDHTDLEEYLYDLEALAEKMGVGDRFEFPSSDGQSFSIFDAPKDDFMAAEYGASDFFILPSTCEGYGLPLVEAMACGVPAIANSFSTIPEHLGGKSGQRHGRTERGFLVGNQVQVHPPCRLLRVIRPDALAGAIWDAFQMTQDEEGQKLLESMRDNCVKYGAGRSWAAMQEYLCNIITCTAGKTMVPVEEL